MTIIDCECFPQDKTSIPAAVHRAGFIEELMEEVGARLPVFKDCLEAINYGKLCFGNEIAIAFMENEVIELSVQIKKFWRRGDVQSMVAPARQRRFVNLAILEAKGQPKGSRLAVAVMDVGTGDGSFLHKIKSWLEVRGYRNVDVQGFDNGDWMKDPMLPNPDLAMKKEFVEMSERVQWGRSGQRYLITYKDVLLKFKPEWEKQFDYVWLNAPPLNMTSSFVQRSLLLLKDSPNSQVILRYEKNSRNFMNVTALMELAKMMELDVTIVNSGSMPRGEADLNITTYLIKPGGFFWRHGPNNADEMFNVAIAGARLVVVSA